MTHPLRPVIYLATLKPVVWMEIAVALGEKGIRRIVFGSPDDPSFLERLIDEEKKRVKQAEFVTDDMSDYGSSLLRRLEEQFAEYLSRKRIQFETELDVSDYSPEIRRFWDAVKEIPYGQVRSYWWVAVRAGSPLSARAVGTAMRINPIPIIIPCHRVVRHNGSLGGYSQGLEWKVKLLELEGVRVENGRVVI